VPSVRVGRGGERGDNQLGRQDKNRKAKNFRIKWFNGRPRGTGLKWGGGSKEKWDLCRGEKLGIGKSWRGPVGDAGGGQEEPRRKGHILAKKRGGKKVREKEEDESPGG